MPSPSDPVDPRIAEDLRVAQRGCDELLVVSEFAAKLARSRATGTPLRIKLGLDPTAPDIHLGHTVVLNKMRQLQDLGHTVIFLIGDFTAQIGDPSGRNATRPPLTPEQIRENAKTYYAQASLVLDPDRTEIRYNSEWCDPLGTRGLIQLASRYTVARMMERDDFTRRFRGGVPISVHEFLYPLLQGYDSVALKADLELGGTDQKFNLLVGRELQKEYGQEPQCVLTMPLLEGTDGVEKMSKSKGNYIGITEVPDSMFGKLMSISDTLDVALFRAAVLPLPGRQSTLCRRKSPPAATRVTPRCCWPVKSSTGFMAPGRVRARWSNSMPGSAMAQSPRTCPKSRSGRRPWASSRCCVNRGWLPRHPKPSATSSKVACALTAAASRTSLCCCRQAPTSCRSANASSPGSP